MNCLSDSICSATPVLDWILTATVAIDYYGTLLFGGQWKAIGPDVVAQADAFQAMIVGFLDPAPGGCQRFASAGAFNG